MTSKWQKTGMKVGSLSVYVRDDSPFPGYRMWVVKVGVRGHSVRAEEFFSSFPKGRARKIRKGLSLMGFESVARVSRLPLLGVACVNS